MRRIIALPVFILALLVFQPWADPTYDKTKRANRLYAEGKYDEALSLYEEALIENPSEKRLAANRGSALHRLGDYDKAAESYEEALDLKNSTDRAAVHYNLGTTLFTKGEQLHGSGQPQARDYYEKARNSFIQALDLAPDDIDTKWNLQLVQARIRELEQQQQQQQQNQDQNQDRNQDKNRDQQQQQQKDEQNKQNQEKQDGENQSQDRDQQQNQDQQNDPQQSQGQNESENDKDGGRKPRPQPQDERQEMEKREAVRLLQQYADDKDELNKPRQDMRASDAANPERDW